MGINLIKELGYDENSEEVRKARKTAKFSENLPSLPEGLVWSIESYIGNYEDGVYAEGQKVLVSIRKPGKILWWNTNPRINGVISLISDAQYGDEIILDAVQRVYKSFQARIAS
jgi:hypothetical protein